MSTSRPAGYREAHSALDWPLLAYGLSAPAAGMICVILGVAVSQPWFFVIIGALFVPVMICTTLLYRNWPTGIRFDGSAISIGAIGSARAARRRPTVNHQSRGLFTCPWGAAEGVRVVTDRAELRKMKNQPRYYTFTNRWGGKSGMSHCRIGVLASPFMRAALVIDVDTLAVTAPQIRPARYYNNFKNGYFSRLVQPELSPTWVVPTRNPQALSEALKAIPGKPGNCAATVDACHRERGRTGQCHGGATTSSARKWPLRRPPNASRGPA
jgi:hypothetical protein